MHDLGQKDDCCTGPAMVNERDQKVRYPTLYFTCDEECELPDEGTAVIKFKKVESVETTRNDEDPKYRYELEVQGIEVKTSKKEDDDKPEDMLIKGMRKAMKKEDE